jgi:hypothetical protein
MEQFTKQLEGHNAQSNLEETVHKAAWREEYKGELGLNITKNKL